MATNRIRKGQVLLPHLQQRLEGWKDQIVEPTEVEILIPQALDVVNHPYLNKKNLGEPWLMIIQQDIAVTATRPQILKKQIFLEGSK